MRQAAEKNRKIACDLRQFLRSHITDLFGIFIDKRINELQKKIPKISQEAGGSGKWVLLLGDLYGYSAIRLSLNENNDVRPKRKPKGIRFSTFFYRRAVTCLQLA